MPRRSEEGRVEGESGVGDIHRALAMGKATRRSGAELGTLVISSCAGEDSAAGPLACLLHRPIWKRAVDVPSRFVCGERRSTGPAGFFAPCGYLLCGHLAMCALRIERRAGSVGGAANPSASAPRPRRLCRNGPAPGFPNEKRMAAEQASGRFSKDRPPTCRPRRAMRLSGAGNAKTMPIYRVTIKTVRSIPTALERASPKGRKEPLAKPPVRPIFVVASATGSSLRRAHGGPEQATGSPTHPRLLGEELEWRL